MAIEQYLSNIRINGGSPGIAFGGYIFSARAETAFTNASNKCNIRVIVPNSPNIPNPPEPSLIKDYVLSINNCNYFAYLLESTVEKTVGETILNLVFCDKSVILDRNVIGLYKRAANKTGTYGNLHVIGEEVGIKTSPDGQKFCLGCDESIIPINGEIPITLECESRDVYYTARDFSGAVSNAGIGISGLSGAGHFSYVGSVREVLNSICSDLGLTWYFDWTTNTVKVINSGVSIPIINLNNPKITSYSKTKSKEGTFSSNSNTFSILSGQTASLSAEDYTQITLSYQGPDVTEDVVCAALAQISKDLRDDYAYGRGMYYRLGFSGTVFGGFQNIGSGVIGDAAEKLGDKALWDLAKGYSHWVIAKVDPELRSYWEAREAGALQLYGKKYKASSVPSMHDYKKCEEGNYSIDIGYDRYPSFDDAGNWEKQVGIYKTEGGGGYVGRYTAVVVPLIGQLYDAVYSLIPMPSFSLGGNGGMHYIANRSPITSTNAFSFITQAQNSGGGGAVNGLSLVGWPGKPYGNAFGQSSKCPHPDEEVVHPVKQNNSSNCNVDPCGGEGTDPCAQYNGGCSNNGVGIQQGISNNQGWCYGGVILPSTATFYGWIRKKRDVSKFIKGSSNIVNGDLDSEDVKEARFQSIDVSKGDASGPAGAFYGMAESLTVEYVGIEEVPILGGLTNFSYLIDSNGAFTSVTYNSRPIESPKPDPVLGKVIVKKLAF
jgi:hypothetical protein